MSKKYRFYDQKQSLLLPLNIQDWLPDGHLAIFISNVVDELDLSPIFRFYEDDDRGAPPYDPQMMTKILFYAYCNGIQSSRKIEKKQHEDIAFRYLAANNFPNFRTISDFRKNHIDVLEDLFIQVLLLCDEAGLVKLGTVALDGTKVKANASLQNSKKYETLCKEEEQVREKVREMFRNAEQTDEEEDRLYGEDKRGDELPPGFQDKKERLQRIRKAKEQLDEKQKQRYQEYQNNLQERKQKEKETGKKPRGRKPHPVSKEPDGQSKANTTDPDSRVMKTRQGFTQGYNGQAMVDVDSQIIVAGDLVQDENDKHQQIPMMKKTKENMGRNPKKATMDAGYWDKQRLKQLDKDVDLYVATQKDWKERKKLRNRPPPRGRIPKNMSYKERMERKLLTKKGREIYQRRGSSVEPVFGQIKNRGLGQLLLRGLEKAKGEWMLICLSHNLLKLWKAKTTKLA
jgi:transposase